MIGESIFRYLDTEYVDVDVQPEYVRVTIKEKVLQLTLPCEVSVDNSTAKRNTTNGKLVVTMPRLKPIPIIRTRDTSKKPSGEEKRVRKLERSSTTMREYLEIGPATDDLDFSKIVNRRKTMVEPSAVRVQTESNGEHDDAYDNPDVPPLE